MSPAPPAKKTTLTIQAEDLVRHFHKTLSGIEKQTPASTEVDRAMTLLTSHGWDKACYIVEWAINEAKKTNFKMATFGAVLQYEYRAAHKYDQWKRERETAAKREAERQEKERLDQAYNTYGTQLLNNFLSQPQQAEIFQELVTNKKRELRAGDGIFANWKEEELTRYVERFVRNEVIAPALAAQEKLLTFDQFCELNRGVILAKDHKPQLV